MSMAGERRSSPVDQRLPRLVAPVGAAGHGAGARTASDVPAVLIALANPLRRQLLHLLSGREEVSVAAIRRTMSLSASTVVYHARILTRAGLIDARKQGRSIYYALRAETIRGIRDELASLIGPSPASSAPVAPDGGRATPTRPARRSATPTALAAPVAPDGPPACRG